VTDAFVSVLKRPTTGWKDPELITRGKSTSFGRGIYKEVMICLTMGAHWWLFARRQDHQVAGVVPGAEMLSLNSFVLSIKHAYGTQSMNMHLRTRSGSTKHCCKAAVLQQQHCVPCCLQAAILAVFGQQHICLNL
jgi:hypothetical protein